MRASNHEVSRYGTSVIRLEAASRTTPGHAAGTLRVPGSSDLPYVTVSQSACALNWSGRFLIVVLNFDCQQTPGSSFFLS